MRTEQKAERRSGRDMDKKRNWAVNERKATHIEIKNEINVE